MNKSITDGVVLMPPAFESGLNVWSSGNGTPGTDTYANSVNAAYVPADQDFAGCLELLKTSNTQYLRYMGQTPILPGCYLRITARVKVMSGSLPNVRIAGYPAKSNGSAVSGVQTFGPTTTISEYGSVTEISAIVGAGQRSGVDMVWGSSAVYGHFGLDLTGPNGGVIRVDDLIIEDITSAFLQDMMAMVDVRDYGAIGDGSTDDSAAFDAANADANGREVLVPDGTYYLGNDVTFDTKVKFEGKVVVPADKLFLLRKQFDIENYIDAFKDEEIAFKKAYQALLNNVDHESLDLCGRRIFIKAPIDMQAATPERTSYATRRVIQNGQIEASKTGDWDTETVTSQATYSASNSKKLTNVTNISNIQVGSLVEGVGVGREVYVRSKNNAAKEVTLSAGLYDAEGTQVFTFNRFKYILDFSGYSKMTKFILADVELQCNNKASGILLAPSGIIFQLRDCFISRPGNRGLTSHGEGCQGMLIDNCQFLSAEDGLNVDQRVSIALNSNANDLKIRNNRATKFRHFAVLGGSNTLFFGNHFFQGDGVHGGIRTAGVILTKSYSSTVISGNYIDNCFIEWTNEYDSTPDFTSGFSFSSLGMNDNVFLSGAVAPWFSYFVVKPHGTGHFLNGVSVTGNRFRSLEGTIDRADRVDTSFSDLNYQRMKNVNFSNNSFNNVSVQTANPLVINHDQSSAASTWTIDSDGRLPFESQALNVDSIVVLGKLRNSSNVATYTPPAADTRKGTAYDKVQLTWDQPVRGTVRTSLRMDS